MNREIINTIFDKIISKEDTIKIKCKPSDGKRLNEAYDLYAQKIGLKITTNDNSEIHKLYTDDKFNATIEFTKDFIDENIVDIKNTDKKLINIKEIYNAYNNLPDKLKEKINTIRFVKGDEYDEKNGIGGWSKFLDEKILDVSGMYIPHYIFYHDDKILGNYEMIIAHEAMHNYDYPNLDKKTFEQIKNAFSDNPSIENLLKLSALQKKYSLEETHINTHSTYKEVVEKNKAYLLQQGMGKDIDELNYASKHAKDYGLSEDYADAGAIIILGYKNPDNPNAVLINTDKQIVQYREWIKTHPYQAQYMVKELFDEDVSIEYLLKQAEL